MPPLSVDLDKAYHVGVTCFVSSQFRSTSDLHEESKSGRQAIAYGEPCGGEGSDGLFSHPSNLKLIVVPRAGRARFWVQFELGKFLFPKINDDSLEILHPQIAADAEHIFGVKFVQGCHWG